MKVSLKEQSFGSFDHIMFFHKMKVQLSGAAWTKSRGLVSGLLGLRFDHFLCELAQTSGPHGTQVPSIRWGEAGRRCCRGPPETTNSHWWENRQAPAIRHIAKCGTSHWISCQIILLLANNDLEKMFGSNLHIDSIMHLRVFQCGQLTPRLSDPLMSRNWEWPEEAGSHSWNALLGVCSFD